MSSTADPDLASTIAVNLQFLRRYARALTGSQQDGDLYAAATIEAIVADDSMLRSIEDHKLGLFRTFHLMWSSVGAPIGEPDTTLSARAQRHMAKLTPNSREALLLFAVEGFSAAEIGYIMDVAPEDATDLIEFARREMKHSVTGKVLVIEDEAIIAMDLVSIVKDMGHRITGVARTRTDAVNLAEADPPDPILADIQLADNSSGLDAVNDILRQFESVPVIFITAFPERFLSGTSPEPAFLITKPFTEDQVRSAVSQAMFFSSTETLDA